MDMPGWMKSVEQRLREYDKRLRVPPTSSNYQMRGAGETTPSGAWYTLIYWVNTHNTDGIDYSGTSTFTIRRAGLYSIKFQAMFRNEVSSNGVRAVMILRNGGPIAGHYSAPVAGQADYVSAGCTTDLFLNAGDTLQFQTLQNSGGTVTIHGSPWTYCIITKIG